MSTSRADVAEGLATVLGGAEIVDLRQLSGGASRETWSFAARAADDQRESLILQRQRPGSERDMAVEVAVLRVARSAGVPVAEVVASGPGDDALGAAYMVVRRVDGETIARKILRDEEFARARTVLPGQLGTRAGRAPPAPARRGAGADVRGPGAAVPGGPRSPG